MAKYIVQHRRGTSEQWAAKDTIIPQEGELVIELDTESSLHKLKIGDGIHTYAELSYLMAGDEIVTQVLSQAKPRIITVALSENWTADINGKYSQVVELENITKYSRLDLQPDADMQAEFKNLNLVFNTENNNGVITVYSIGDMPSKAYTMQATIVETEPVEDCEKVIGITVGTPAAGGGITYKAEESKWHTLAGGQYRLKITNGPDEPEIVTALSTGTNYCFVNDVNLGTGEATSADGEEIRTFTDGNYSVVIRHDAESGVFKTMEISENAFMPDNIGIPFTKLIAKSLTVVTVEHPVDTIVQGENVKLDYNDGELTVNADAEKLNFIEGDEDYGFLEEPEELTDNQILSAKQISRRLNFHNQGLDTGYRLTSSGWKRVMTVIRTTAGQISFDISKASPNGMYVQNLGIMFTGYVEKPNMVNDGTKPLIYQLYENSFGEYQKTDAGGFKPCRITKVRIGYPDPAYIESNPNAWPDTSISTTKPNNPINCYIDVYAEYDEAMQVTNFPVALGIHSPTKTISHNCTPIKVETNATEVGQYGEPLVFEEFEVQEGYDIVSNGKNKLSEIESTKVTSDNVNANNLNGNQGNIKNIDANRIYSDEIFTLASYEDAKVWSEENYDTGIGSFEEVQPIKLKLSEPEPAGSRSVGFINFYRAFNLLYLKQTPVGTNQTTGGLTWKVEKNGSIILNGSRTSSNRAIQLFWNTDTPIYVPEGTYILNDCEIRYTTQLEGTPIYEDNDPYKEVIGYTWNGTGLTTVSAQSSDGGPGNITWSVGEGGCYITQCCVYAKKGQIFDNTSFCPMLSPLKVKNFTVYNAYVNDYYIGYGNITINTSNGEVDASTAESFYSQEPILIYSTGPVVIDFLSEKAERLDPIYGDALGSRPVDVGNLFELYNKVIKNNAFIFNYEGSDWYREWYNNPYVTLGISNNWNVQSLSAAKKVKL